jgi:hypothetical protein
LSQAGKSVSPAESAPKIRANLKVTAPSPNFLVIRVQAGNAGVAGQLSQAVATAYSNYVFTTLKGAGLGNKPQVFPTTTAAASESRLLLKRAAIGLVVGLVLGSIVVLVRFRRDRRLRLRDEVARAIGAPVVASINGEACRTTEAWARVLHQHQPSTVDAWNLRRLLAWLSPEGTPAGADVVVVSFGRDQTALSAGPQLISFGAGMGLSTTLIPGDHEALTGLRAVAVTRPIRAKPWPQNRPWSWDSNLGAESDGPGPGLDRGQLTVSVIAVDEERPVLSPGYGITVLAVSSGYASAEALALLALAAADAGQPIEGIVVVNPDPSDDTTGSVPNSMVLPPPRLSSNGTNPVSPSESHHEVGNGYR